MSKKLKLFCLEWRRERENIIFGTSCFANSGRSRGIHGLTRVRRTTTASTTTKTTTTKESHFEKDKRSENLVKMLALGKKERHK